MTPREAELTSQLEASLSALKAARQENALLRQKIDLLVRRVFGSTSERLSPGQLELLLALSETPATVVPAEKPAPRNVSRPQKERAPRLPEHLPVVEEIVDPDQAVPGPMWAEQGGRPQGPAKRSANSSTTNRAASSAVGWSAPSMSARTTATRPRSSPRCPHGCRTGASLHPACWPTCWSANTATIFRSIGRRRSMPAATA